jgi:hypothetical protein
VGGFGEVAEPLRSGVHPKVVQERLGHANISITMDTYSHVTAGMQKDAAEQVARSIFGVSSSGTRVPVWLRYLCSSRGWGLGGVGSLGSTAGVGESTCFS